MKRKHVDRERLSRIDETEFIAAWKNDGNLPDGENFFTFQDAIGTPDIARFLPKAINEVLAEPV